MNNNHPIGVFDSGIGGLTVANAIYRALPNEQIIYFGDTAHMPFGDKSPAAIRQYSRGVADFLLKQNCKTIVIACNSASSVAHAELLQYVGDRCPVINVIDPVVDAVLGSQLKRVAVIATRATIKSGVYVSKLKQGDPQLEVISRATRSLAMVIEEGWHHSPPLLQAIINYYFDNETFQEIDGLILGCTHYPLIKDSIQDFFGKSVFIYEVPNIVAQHLKTYLGNRGLLSQKRKSGHKFYVSDLSENFENETKMFFDENIQLEYFPLWQ